MKRVSAEKLNREFLEQSHPVKVIRHYLEDKEAIRFNPAAAGRALIRRSLLRYENVHAIPRQVAARWLVPETISIDNKRREP